MSCDFASAAFPRHVDPAQWSEATGLARLACARIFRDGGAPADALSAFALTSARATPDWRSAVDTIATHLCGHARMRRAA